MVEAPAKTADVVDLKVARKRSKKRPQMEEQDPEEERADRKAAGASKAKLTQKERLAQKEKQTLDFIAAAKEGVSCRELAEHCSISYAGAGFRLNKLFKQKRIEKVDGKWGYWRLRAA